MSSLKCTAEVKEQVRSLYGVCHNLKLIIFVFVLSSAALTTESSTTSFLEKSLLVYMHAVNTHYHAFMNWHSACALQINYCNPHCHCLNVNTHLSASAPGSLCRIKKELLIGFSECVDACGFGVTVDTHTHTKKKTGKEEFKETRAEKTDGKGEKFYSRLSQA